MAAGRGFSAKRGQVGLDESGPAPAGMRGPDISNLSPQGRADRLYNRVMLLAGEGNTPHQEDITIALSQAQSNGAAR